MEILFLKIIFAVLAGYFLGSCNGAQLLHHFWRARFTRHITAIGTGNAGTQNVWMQMGRAPAVFVLLVDILKGYFSVWLASVIGIASPLVFIGGIAAIAGHNWPIYFHFHGGRGVATLTGALFAFDFSIAFWVTIASLLFVLIRWSGVMPLALIVGTAVLTYREFGGITVWMMALAAAVILARRFQVHRRYDRPGANPPSLREIFMPEAVVIKT